MKNIINGNMNRRHSNMNIRVIKTEEDYLAALKELERLMSLHPKLGSEDSDRLELLSLLLEKYEQERFPIELPDPVSAIKFVMEQRGLIHSDLEKYLGSRGRVSEILAGKRPLSKRMMRALHEGLGIPAEVLLNEPGANLPKALDLDWTSFPLKEMQKNDYFAISYDNLSQLKEYAEDLVRPMIETLEKECCSPALSRSSAGRVRSKKEIDGYSLAAWQARIVEKAVKNKLPHKYLKGIDEKFLNHVGRLTILDNGPLAALEILNKQGIHLIIERHFPNTYLDGASMMLKDGTPIIGLTLRYDRLDNFWFTLMHELVHVAFHLSQDKSPIFDDLDESPTSDPLEKQADELAEKTLLPQWSRKQSETAEKSKTMGEIRQLARNLGVHEAILAGRIQHDTNKFAKYRSMLGLGIPSKLFATLSKN